MVWLQSKMMRNSRPRFISLSRGRESSESRGSWRIFRRMLYLDGAMMSSCRRMSPGRPRGARDTRCTQVNTAVSLRRLRCAHRPAASGLHAHTDTDAWPTEFCACAWTRPCESTHGHQDTQVQCVYQAVHTCTHPRIGMHTRTRICRDMHVDADIRLDFVTHVNQGLCTHGYIYTHTDSYTRIRIQQ